MNQKITVQAGTTLFHVAARYLGDASQWARIARINGLRDPFLSEIVTLEIPSTRTSRGQGIGIGF